MFRPCPFSHTSPHAPYPILLKPGRLTLAAAAPQAEAERATAEAAELGGCAFTRLLWELTAGTPRRGVPSLRAAAAAAVGVLVTLLQCVVLAGLVAEQRWELSAAELSQQGQGQQPSLGSDVAAAGAASG